MTPPELEREGSGGACSIGEAISCEAQSSSGAARYTGEHALDQHTLRLTGRAPSPTSVVQMSKSYSPTRWLLRKNTDRTPQLRLFCFPHAGAGAALYSRWLNSFPESIDVCAIDPPGRLSRLRDPAPANMAGLIAALDVALDEYLDLPFAVFGYSLGALTAFEWCRSIRRRLGREPACMMVAAAGAPQLGSYRKPISDLPGEEFLQALEGRYGAIDPMLRAEPGMLELIAGIMRSDLRLLEQYQYAAEPPFACPLVAFGGTQDSGVPSERIAAWQAQTSAAFHTQLFEGEHFFIRAHGTALAQAVQSCTSKAVEQLRSGAAAR